MAEKATRYSFAEAAAQQPERQRFSFSAAAPQKPLTLTESLDKQFPHREMLRNISAQSVTPPKPPAGQMAKEFVIPGRGFTDEQIAQADPTLKDKAVGLGRAGLEIGVGLATLTHMGGNQLMRILPGYGKEEAVKAAEARNKLLEPIEPFITPKTAKEAQVMRFADIAGFAVGWTKAGRLNQIKKALVNVDNVDDARKILRSSELTDDIITRLNLDQAVVNIKNTKDANAFVKRVDDIMEQAANAAKSTGPTLTKQPAQTTQPPRTVDGSPVTPTRVPTPTQPATTPSRFSFAETARQTPTAAVARQTTPPATSAVPTAPTTRTDITRGKIEADLDEARFVEGEVMPGQQPASVETTFRESSNQFATQNLPDNKLPKFDDNSREIRRVERERFSPLEERKPQKSGFEQIFERLEMNKRIELSRADKKMLDTIMFDDVELDEIYSFIKKVGPQNLQDVRLSIRRLLPNNAAGNFNFDNAIISLSRSASTKGTLALDTIVHELWHALSRNLPTDKIKLLQLEYDRVLKSFLRENSWFRFIYRNGKKTKDGDIILTVEDVKRYENTFGRNGSSTARQQTFTKLSNGTYRYNFDTNTYRFKNIDEFFAEELTSRTLKNKFSPKVKTFIEKIKDAVWSVVDMLGRAFGKPDTRRLLENTYDAFLRQKYTKQVRSGPIDKANTMVLKKDTQGGTPQNPIQTANAERAEQVIKRQPKPEQVAEEAAEVKKWESNPVKVQSEATQEVATKYSNTVADKGFISEGAAKIDGVPPVKNVRAKARNFAKDNDVPIDLPPQTWAGYFITQVQDTAYRLGLVQKQLTKAGAKISDDANAYLQREAYIGRAASKIEKKRKELGMVAGSKNGLFMRMKRDGVDIESLNEYMTAKAAIDRNKRVASLKDGIPDGGSGITNAEASEILAKYKGNTKVEAYAQEFRDSVITPRLQLLKEAGILTDEQIANITKYEPNYVPFKVAEFDRIQGGGKGFSVKGSGVKGLRGSARKDRTNSVMQAVADYEDAVQRSEKNKSLQAMGKLIEENPDKTLWEVKGVQYIPQYDEVGELQFLRQRPLNEKTSVEFFKDGKAYEIRFHDEALAKVFTQEGMYKPIAALRVINNYLRAVNTVINPEFMITNAMRDAQTALVIAGGEKGMLTAAKIAKDYPAASKGIWQAVRKESNTGWAKIYNEMVEAGGRTGWFDLKEVSESTKEVSRLVNRYNSSKTSDSLMRAVDSTAKLISDVNEVGEMAVRVSAYKQLVDAGMTKTQAANYAKNMTVNFNKRGNIGMLANSLYLFANAGIQGSARLLMAMKNPKVRRITYGIVGSSYAINELNNKINPEGYERIQDFEKERNLIIMLPLDGNKYNLPGVSGDPSNGYYFKVPLPYGFNVFKVVGDATYDMVHGKKTSGEMMKKILMAIDASFNPLSSGTPIQFVSPTVVDPFVSSWENKNWFGAPIMPDQPAFAPAVRDSDRYFSGARDISVETAQFLNRLTGGNEVTAGAVDISPETIDHVIDSLGGGLGNFLGQFVDGSVNVVKGDIPAPEEMPFVRKFIDTPFEKGEQMQAFQLLEQSATKPLNQIQTDRFIDSVIDATVRGDMTVETGERMFTQFQQNVARNYAGEILSLFNEGKLDDALELYQSTPTQVKKELDKLIEKDLEREINRQEK